MKNKRVVVAMSGGVDSSVAAALLVREGFEVIGVTMRLWPKELCGKHKARSCCSLKDIEDARRVANRLGIKFFVMNFEREFKREVINYFVSEYLSGRTPNPCILCNNRIKFGTLLKKVAQLGADFVATGHYARIYRDAGKKILLMEGLDKTKDQSYVLFGLTRFQLSNSLFPLGGFKKDRVRKIAKELGLPVFDKLDSQEVCFLPDNSYRNFISKMVGPSLGRIEDADGRFLGWHDGFWNFTIGQRRGLGIACGRPLYVIDINRENNTVVVGEQTEVKKKRFLAERVNWIIQPDKKILEANVKIRYNHKKSKAELNRISKDLVEVEFEEPQEAITPGQAAVFYDGEFVLGGGWIK